MMAYLKKFALEFLFFQKQYSPNKQNCFHTLVTELKKIYLLCVF